MVVMILILGITGTLLALTVTYVGPQLYVMIPIAGTGILALVFRLISLYRKPSPHDIEEIRKVLLEETSNVSKPPSLERLNATAEQIGMKLDEFFTDLAKGTILDQGMKALMEQDYETAIVMFEKNTKIQRKETALSWFFEGNALYFKGEYREAILAYQKSTNFNPRFTKAWYNWGETLKALDRHEEAMDKYNKAVEHDSSIANVENISKPVLMSISAPEEKVEGCNQMLELETDLAKT